MKKILLLASIFICSLSPAQEILTLKDCLRMGEDNNPYVKNTRLDILSSKALKGELTWEYFPTVSLYGLGYYAQKPLISISPTDILGTSDFAWELNNAYVNLANENGLKTRYTTMKKGYATTLSLMQPIYAGGRIFNGNRLAAVGIEASQLQAEVKIRDIREEVEGKYWLVVALQEKMTTLDKAGAVIDSLYRFVSSAQEAGLVADADVVNVKQKMAELSSGRVKLRNGLKLAKMDLFNAIGFKYEYLKLDSYRLSGELDSIESVESIVAESDALPIESRLLEIQEKAKKLEKRVSIGEFLPEVGIGLFYAYDNIQNKNSGQFNGMGVISVKIPLTGIGKAAERARRMDYEIEKVRNEKVYLEAQLELQKHQLFLAIETAQSQAEMSKSLMDDAQTQLWRCEGSYKAGRSTLSDLLQAELQYRNAAEQYIDDCIEHRKAVSAYKRMYGTHR